MTEITPASAVSWLPSQQDRRLHFDINHEEGWALAQWLKRAGLNHYRQLAIDDNEAYLMQSAAARLRSALASAGFAPR